MYTIGKPGKAGGPLQGSAYTWKPVYAGCLIVCIREARQSGRPGDQYTVRYMEAGPCGRPYCIHLGSPTMREAHRFKCKCNFRCRCRCRCARSPKNTFPRELIIVPHPPREPRLATNSSDFDIQKQKTMPKTQSLRN